MTYPFIYHLCKGLVFKHSVDIIGKRNNESIRHINVNIIPTEFHKIYFNT